MSFGAPFPAGCREVLLTYLDHAEITASATTYNFTGLNFGTLNPDQYIVVCLTWFAGVLSTFISCTIGGISATAAVSVGVNISGVVRSSAIFVVKVPSGSPGTVSFTLANVGNAAAVAVYSVSGIPSAVPASTATSTANNPTGSLNIARNGAVIAVAAAGAGSSPSATWSGLTEDTDNNYGSGNLQCRSSASAQFSTAQTGLSTTCTFSTTTGSAGCFAVFEPA